jgi:uroporphyrinogen decarboxylase
MSLTSRELVQRTLACDNPPRAPREVWILPIAKIEHPSEAEAIPQAFPADFDQLPPCEDVKPATKGDPYEIGEFEDYWGCKFINLQRGVIGEVKEPLIRDWATDRDKVRFPRELLTLDRDTVNRHCAATTKYTRAGRVPRPFEQLQFIRGTEDFFCDLLDPVPEMTSFIRDMHNLYCEVYTLWAKTDVDSMMIMDDWGSQRSLLIAPALWREIFKPMYRDYIQIAHSHGKKMFMHSDGYILDILPDLIEIGLDAINAQLFCMGLDKLAPFAGKITFWGEIDRQHLLPNGTTGDIDKAVRDVHAALWKNGGCIAQCEFGAAAKPENVRQVFDTWNALASDPSAV